VGYQKATISFTLTPGAGETQQHPGLRFEMLQQIAQYQLRVLAEAEQIKQLPDQTENQ